MCARPARRFVYMKHLAVRRKRVFAKFDDAEFDDAEHAFGNGDGKANGAGVIVAPFGKGGGSAGGGGQDLVGGGLRRFGSLGQAASGMLRSSGSLKMQARLPHMPGHGVSAAALGCVGAASARCLKVLQLHESQCAGTLTGQLERHGSLRRSCRGGAWPGRVEKRRSGPGPSMRRICFKAFTGMLHASRHDRHARLTAGTARCLCTTVQDRAQAAGAPRMWLSGRPHARRATTACRRPAGACRRAAARHSRRRPARGCARWSGPATRRRRACAASLPAPTHSRRSRSRRAPRRTSPVPSQLSKHTRSHVSAAVTEDARTGGVA